ncbi:monocarboxylate transporter 12-B isoform X2 [Austrofundulus limnaeus]|uniref:Monocarboxylate transporter 12-B isoform X2 n=1 Tax=Austrofundulus limnaeus TaxID=52670 RepID=A0A2I4AYS9_AUSLI|nr:PREDICTED: monocarboxylate transporter 12-B-like isoform X2 [Austrofundulus limnaeus]
MGILSEGGVSLVPCPYPSLRRQILSDRGSRDGRQCTKKEPKAIKICKEFKTINETCTAFIDRLRRLKSGADVMADTKEEKLEGGRRMSGVMKAPEGGWGWMIVAGCFLATICIRAVTRCISMFFVEFQMHFEKDYASTAWIHSMTDSTTMLCAPLGSFLGNRLSCRATVFLGGLLSSVGLVLSSFATSLEFLYISLGVITGSGIGTFLLAPAVQLLIEHYSWRGAMLILGGFVSNLCVCGALMRPLEQKNTERMWKNSLENVVKARTTAVLESEFTEPVTADCSQVTPKQQKVHNLKDTLDLVIAIGTFPSFGYENTRLQRNITLLPNPELPDKRNSDKRMNECILFSNKMETMLGGMEKLDQNGTLINDLQLVESINSNNTLVATNLKRQHLDLNEANSIDDIDETVSTEPLVNSPPLSRCQRFCLKFKEEFGFFVIPNFLILSVSFLFLAYGCSAPVVYLVPYALSVGVKHQLAAFLMSLFGVSGIVGNITFGWITDRKCLKRYRILSYILAIVMEGLCCIALPFLHSFSLLVPFSTLYGYFDGAYVALIPVVTSDAVGSSHLTSALGVVYFLHAVPYLVSPPIGGWLVDQTGNYASTFFLSAASFILSSLILVTAVSLMTLRGMAWSEEQHPQEPKRSQLVHNFLQKGSCGSV